MLNYDYAAKLFGILYDNVDGYSVSHEARANHVNGIEIMYGELPFATWSAIVEAANPKKDGVFMDVGSGTGRVVLQSHLLFDFNKSIGVELLPGLHKKALQVQEIFEKNVKPQILNHVIGRELQLINKNIFDVDLSEVDFLFMNHPFKDKELFKKLEEKFLRELKSGTKIVTIIRALESNSFKSLGSKKYQFSWGDSTAYFHEIKPN